MMYSSKQYTRRFSLVKLAKHVRNEILKGNDFDEFKQWYLEKYGQAYVQSKTL